MGSHLVLVLIISLVVVFGWATGRAAAKLERATAEVGAGDGGGRGGRRRR
jgi:hypothetical protein